MAKRRFDEIRLVPSRGLVDGRDEQDVPHDGVWDATSYEFRKGWARTVAGRLKSTTGGQLVDGKRVRAIWEWTWADGSVNLYTVINGDLWLLSESDAVISLDVHRNFLELGASTATRSSNTVTVTGGKLLNSVRPGDWFVFSTDTGGSVASVDSDTQLTLNSYTGDTDSGHFTLQRKLGERSAGDVYADSEVSMAVFEDRLYVADGYGPLHWLDTSFTFRPVGVMKPDARPTLVDAEHGNSGITASSTYIYAVAYKDANDTIGPRVDSIPIAVGATTPGVTVTCNDTPPSWATKRILFRTFAGGAVLYRTSRDIASKAKSLSHSAPNTTFTLDDEAETLRSDAHRDQYIKFATSGNSYKISGNSATQVVTATDASGESATDFFTILAEYDIDDTSYVDLFADAELDTDFEAPGFITNTERSYNEPPPTGLKYLTRFRGDGRLCAYEDGTVSRVWFSGRPQFASKTGQAEYFGEGEPEYWPIYHDAGPKDGDELHGLIPIGGRLCGVKRNTVWLLDDESSDVSIWGWGPIAGAEGIGAVSPKSIVVHKGVAWWLGRVAEQLDIIRFDGVFARGFGRPVIGAVLDAINEDYLSEATGVVFGNRYYLSYPHSTNTTNSRTLRFDFETQTWDVQPWGCGVFLARPSDSTLLCGAPDSVGDIFHVLGSAQDNGSDIARVLQTGDVGFKDIEHPVHWTEIALEIKIE